jgi:hypothetical protein
VDGKKDWDEGKNLEENKMRKTVNFEGMKLDDGSYAPARPAVA